jgi:hypothetical protein
VFSDPEGARNEYQMSGIPDGLGAYKSDKGMLKVLMNHELDGTPPDSPEGVGCPRLAAQPRAGNPDRPERQLPDHGSRGIPAFLLRDNQLHRRETVVLHRRGVDRRGKPYR